MWAGAYINRLFHLISIHSLQMTVKECLAVGGGISEICIGDQ